MVTLSDVPEGWGEGIVEIEAHASFAEASSL
jgi:hypothetical protein